MFKEEVLQRRQRFLAIHRNQEEIAKSIRANTAKTNKKIELTSATVWPGGTENETSLRIGLQNIMVSRMVSRNL